MQWADGTRVRIAPHPLWPDGAVGTVREFPEYVAELCCDADDCTRVVQGAQGPLTMVWVRFDEPVQDGEGDGPYREGEVFSEYLFPM